MSGHVLIAAGAALAATTLLAVGTADAAVIQKDAEGGVVTISDGLVMKEFPGGQKAIFDSKRALMTAAFPARGFYTAFTREQFCNLESDGGGFQVDDVTDSLFSVFDAFPGRRYDVDVEDAYRVIESDPEPKVVVVEPRPVRKPGEPPRVRIVDKGRGGKIAGYPTRRYRVFVDGRLEEEIWMADDPRLLEELGKLDMRAVLGFFQCDESTATPDELGADANEKYRELFERGWPLRIKSGGDDAYFRVVSIELKDVPATAFTVPQRLRAVPFDRRLLTIDDPDD